jgi:hypothetical protein
MGREGIPIEAADRDFQGKQLGRVAPKQQQSFESSDRVHEDARRSNAWLDDLGLERGFRRMRVVAASQNPACAARLPEGRKSVRKTKNTLFRRELSGDPAEEQ